MQNRQMITMEKSAIVSICKGLAGWHVFLVQSLEKRMQQVWREIFMTSGNTPCGFRAYSRAPIRGLTTPFRVLQSCTGD